MVSTPNSSGGLNLALESKSIRLLLILSAPHTKQMSVPEMSNPGAIPPEALTAQTGVSEPLNGSGYQSSTPSGQLSDDEVTRFRRVSEIFSQSLKDKEIRHGDMLVNVNIAQGYGRYRGLCRVPLVLGSTHDGNVLVRYMNRRQGGSSVSSSFTITPSDCETEQLASRDGGRTLRIVTRKERFDKNSLPCAVIDFDAIEAPSMSARYALMKQQFAEDSIGTFVSGNATLYRHHECGTGRSAGRRRVAYEKRRAARQAAESDPTSTRANAEVRRLEKLENRRRANVTMEYSDDGLSVHNDITLSEIEAETVAAATSAVVAQ